MKENGLSVAGSGAGTAGINKSGALGYLQELYNDVRQSRSVRMKAAIEALPYEQPRLAGLRLCRANTSRPSWIAR
jgi:hypothetical protein